MRALEISPVHCNNLIDVEASEHQAEEQVEHVGSDIRIAEALVVRLRVSVEVPNALPAPLAVLQMHKLDRQALKTQLVHLGQRSHIPIVHLLAEPGDNILIIRQLAFGHITWLCCQGTEQEGHTLDSQDRRCHKSVVGSQLTQFWRRSRRSTLERAERFWKKHIELSLGIDDGCEEKNVHVVESCK